MASILNNIFFQHENTIETIKLSILIAGIVVGIFRDLTSVNANEMYQLHEKFASESNEVAQLTTVALIDIEYNK